MVKDIVHHHRREGQDVEADLDVAEHFLMGQVAEPGWLVDNLNEDQSKIFKDQEEEKKLG